MGKTIRKCPYPECGSDNITVESDFENRFYFSCVECHCSGPRKNSNDEAFAAWNSIARKRNTKPNKGEKDAYSNPLGKLPLLDKNFNDIITECSIEFRWKTVPTDEQIYRIKKIIEQLFRLDGYKEQDIIDTIIWWLRSSTNEAIFWRSKGCRSLASLRSNCKDGETKFTKMHIQRTNGYGESGNKRAGKYEPPAKYNYPTGDNADNLPF